MASSAVVGGVILTLIEGMGIWMDNYFSMPLPGMEGECPKIVGMFSRVGRGLVGRLRAVSVFDNFWDFVRDCHGHEVRLLFYIHRVLLVANNWTRR